MSLKENNAGNVDRFDRAIMRELQANARITLTELASRVGLTKTPCQLRVKRLEKEGYILGYSALISRSRFGESHVAFVQVKLEDTRTPALTAFNEAAREVREIEECHMMAAGFDYLLKVRTKDMVAYRRVLGEVISALPHVSQTSTFVVMEAVKEVADRFADRAPRSF